MSEFKQYMQDHFELDELRDIARHGCASMAPGGMIYYYETTDLYLNYKDSLHEILDSHMENTGETPKYILDRLGDFTQFANAMVWLCAEIIAYELTNNDIDESEAA
jgi:hypothetical protein